MLKKSSIFYYFSVLIITFAVGLFVWNFLFVKITDNNFKNFTASISNSNEAETVFLEEDSEQDAILTENIIIEPVKSFQDQLDDIQEKLNIIQQQVDELVVNQVLEEEDKEDLEELEEIEENKEVVSCVGQININTASIEDLDKIIGIGPSTAQKIIEARPFCSLNDLTRVSGIKEATLQKIIEQGCAYAVGTCNVSGGGGGGSSDPAPIVYPKIIINEVQIFPIAERFVELYNPNDKDIDLTNWYLQRKDSNDISWGTFVSATNFSGKIIPANGYFLISKEIVDSDILSSITLSSDNSLALKNPNGEISDKLGFGLAQDFELLSTVNSISGQSIGRKVVDGIMQDTDNNLVDFEINTPTPKGQNIKWTEPLPPTLVSIEITTLPTKLDYIVGDELDITGLVVTGTYSDDNKKVETVTLADVTGFDSTSPIIGQVVIISVGAQTVTYTIDINPAPILQSIAITTPANKLVYVVGDLLDVTGLVVTGTYSDSSTKIEIVVPENITGFDSSAAISDQILTITLAGQTTTYTINIADPISPKNFLLNEFFQDWTAGTSEVPPDNWLWSGTASRINQSSDKLVGDYSVQCTPITTANNLVQSGIIIPEAGDYYAEIWIRVMNVNNDNYVRISVDIANPGDGSFPNASFVDYKIEDGWVKLTKNRSIEAGENGGIRIRAQRQGDAGPYFLVGAAWLGTTEPPSGWPL